MCLTASSRSAGIAILPRAAGALQGKGGEEVNKQRKQVLKTDAQAFDAVAAAK